MEVRTEATGFVERIEGAVDRIPDYDPRSGEHLWIMTGAWKVDPKTFTSGEQGILDHESLLIIAGPGCYYCEQKYTPWVFNRRCKGQP